MNNLRTKFLAKAERELASISMLCLLLLSMSARAQNYSIDWHSIDGGGGSSTGGVFSVTGTIGQSDAGTMSGGNYTLNGGFWGIIAAIQTSGAPVLSVTRSNSFFLVSWPDNNTGFLLENNANLANANGWSTVLQTLATNNGTISLTLPSPAGNNFYRLKKP